MKIEDIVTDIFVRKLKVSSSFCMYHSCNDQALLYANGEWSCLFQQDSTASIQSGLLSVQMGWEDQQKKIQWNGIPAGADQGDMTSCGYISLVQIRYHTGVPDLTNLHLRVQVVKVWKEGIVVCDKQTQERCGKVAYRCWNYLLCECNL